VIAILLARQRRTSPENGEGDFAAADLRDRESARQAGWCRFIGLQPGRMGTLPRPDLDDTEFAAIVALVGFALTGIDLVLDVLEEFVERGLGRLDRREGFEGFDSVRFGDRPGVRPAVTLGVVLNLVWLWF